MSFYAQPNLIDQVDYAMNRGTKMLEYMEDYFGIKYPLPKAGKNVLLHAAEQRGEEWRHVTMVAKFLDHNNRTLKQRGRVGNENDKQK